MCGPWCKWLLSPSRPPSVPDRFSRISARQRALLLTADKSASLLEAPLVHSAHEPAVRVVRLSDMHAALTQAPAAQGAVAAAVEQLRAGCVRLRVFLHANRLVIYLATAR